jgi:malto-oligosyltrehalose trehalohydrolase
MDFGAEPGPSGEVSFRLWAPGADRVELCLEKPGGPVFLSMERDEAGWCRLTTDRAGIGALYRYRIDNRQLVPDPASRFQPEGVHGPSQVIDPAAWEWRDDKWLGRPWSEALIYELHVGAFSAAGSFAGVIDKLDYLADLGVTALELMPVGAFPGKRNWGYDGALPFAPDRTYGTPDELKKMIGEAHQRNLMIFLDVVYNHFGPEGNYLHLYAPRFFTDRFETPWGSAINFSARDAPPVRRYFIENVLYWLEEFRFDGLRIDAVHSIFDSGKPHILEEIATTVRGYFPEERHIHLILENDRNQARYLKRGKGGAPRFYEAQWNDDFHHACHVLLTSETKGYYVDYRDNPLKHLGRCLAEGFAYQGEVSTYRNQQKRGEPSRDLPPAAFVSFLQNHDQIGNRALGQRLIEIASSSEALRAVTVILLLSPPPPLLFMGQEWGARQPFPFFCDFGEELATLVYEGRLREFAAFPDFQGREGVAIPDPNREGVFAEAKLDWDDHGRAVHRDWLALHRDLLTIRHREIAPFLPGFAGGSGEFELIGPHGLLVRWRHDSAGLLSMIANLGPQGGSGFGPPPGRLIYSSAGDSGAPGGPGILPPWTVAFFSTMAGEKEG